MKEVVPWQPIVEVLRQRDAECINDKQFYYAFANEVHWPMYMEFLKKNGIEYGKLEVLDKAKVNLDDLPPFFGPIITSRFLGF